MEPDDCQFFYGFTCAVTNWGLLGQPTIFPPPPASIQGIPGNGVFGAVYALKVVDLDVYVGGIFNQVHNAPYNNVAAASVARWNSSTNTWAALGLGVFDSPPQEGKVYALASNGSDIYAGGEFFNACNVGNCVAVSHVAKWNGSSWGGLGDNSGSLLGVNALATAGSSLFVASRLSDSYVRVWNGSSWANYGQRVKGRVESLLIVQNGIYFGGMAGVYDAPGNLLPFKNIVKWNSLINNWEGLGSGANQPVLALAQDSQRLYVGGLFEEAGQKPSTGFGIYATGKAVWSGAVSEDWHDPANWSAGVVPPNAADILIPTGVSRQPAIGSANVSIGSLHIGSDSSLSLLNNRMLTVAGAVRLDAAAQPSRQTTLGGNSGAGTVVLNSDDLSNDGVIGGAQIAVQLGAGTKTLQGAGAWTGNPVRIMSGANVTLTNECQMGRLIVEFGGALTTGNHPLKLNGAGVALTVIGFLNENATVVYNGSSPQTVGNFLYDNLTISATGTVTLGADTTVRGILRLESDLNTGAFALLQQNVSTGDGDVIGTVRRNIVLLVQASFGFGNAQNLITFSGPNAPSALAVTLSKTAASPFNSVARSYTITPTGITGSFSATVRLRYRDAELNGLNESTLRLWRHNGTAWEEKGGTVNTAENYVESSGITAFSSLSTWMIGGPDVPPTVTVNPLARIQGAPVSNATIATLADANQAVTTLAYALTPVSGSGVTFSNFTLDALGQLKANVAVACNAVTSTFSLRVLDESSNITTATLTVTVTPNTLPVLSYANRSLNAGDALTLTPRLDR